MKFDALLRRVLSAFVETDIPYLIGGSYASGVWGEPRHTNDLDVVLDLDNERAEQLVSRLGPEFMVTRNEMQEAIERREPYSSFQILHTEQLFKVDAFVLANDDYSQTEFSRRVRIELVPDLEAFVATSEDIILRKLLWYEMGRRISDRQWNDVVKVIEVQADRLDREYLNEWSRKLSVEDLLGEALSEAWQTE